MTYEDSDNTKGGTMTTIPVETVRAALKQQYEAGALTTAAVGEGIWVTYNELTPTERTSESTVCRARRAMRATYLRLLDGGYDEQSARHVMLWYGTEMAREFGYLPQVA